MPNPDGTMTDAERWDNWLQFWKTNYGADQPGAIYNSMFSGLAGGNVNSPLARYIQQRSGQALTGFMGGLYNDPTLKYEDYLAANVDPLKEWNALSPRGRGENPGLYNPGVRYKPSPFGGMF